MHTPHTTEPLNQIEQSVLPHIVRILLNCKGKAKAVNNRSIAALLYEQGKQTIPESAMRKVINHIRLNGLVPGLIANSQGYFVAADEQEYAKGIESLEQRINAIQAVRDALRQQFLKRFNIPGEQMRLFRK